MSGIGRALSAGIMAPLLVAGCAGAPAGVDEIAASSGPVVKAPSAMRCFSPALSQPGTEYQLRFRSAQPGDAVTAAPTATMDFVVTDAEPVDGMAVSLTTGRGHVTEAAREQAVVQRQYVSIDATAGVLLLRRVETELPAPEGGDSVSVTTHYEPPRRFRFDLKAGQHHQQTYTRETVRRVNGAVAERRQEHVQSRIEFAGMEPTSGPAGLTDTCRFDEERTVGAEASPTRHTFWIAEKTGLPVRERTLQGDAIESTQLLIEATLNGKRVLPGG